MSTRSLDDIVAELNGANAAANKIYAQNQTIKSVFDEIAEKFKRTILTKKNIDMVVALVTKLLENNNIILTPEQITLNQIPKNVFDEYDEVTQCALGVQRAGISSVNETQFQILICRHQENLKLHIWIYTLR